MNIISVNMNTTHWRVARWVLIVFGFSPRCSDRVSLANFQSNLRSFLSE